MDFLLLFVDLVSSVLLSETNRETDTDVTRTRRNEGAR